MVEMNNIEPGTWFSFYFKIDFIVLDWILLICMILFYLIFYLDFNLAFYNAALVCKSRYIVCSVHRYLCWHWGGGKRLDANDVMGTPKTPQSTKKDHNASPWSPQSPLAWSPRNWSLRAILMGSTPSTKNTATLRVNANHTLKRPAHLEGWIRTGHFLPDWALSNFICF